LKYQMKASLYDERRLFRRPDLALMVSLFGPSRKPVGGSPPASF